jgi:integrase
MPIIERVIGEKYLFQSPRGKKYLYSNEGLKLNRYMKGIGLNHTIHETRHTFISQCDRLKLPALAVKRIVGHSTKDITEHYTHKNAADLVQVIDAFDY